MDIHPLVNEGLIHLSPYQPGKSIETLERELGIELKVKLASNENPLGCSPLVYEALQQHMPNLSRYPDPHCFELRAALSNHWAVEPEQLIFSNGLDELFHQLCQTFVKPGESILVPEYSFLSYELVAQGLNIPVKKMPLTDWRVDVDTLIQAIDKHTKILFFANPGNPTGTYIDAQEMDKLLKAIPSEIIVVVDEAYYEYMLQTDYPQTVHYLKQYSNLVITHSFSKAYGLAACRIGYALAHPHIIDMLNRLRSPFNINQVAQVAAVTALQDKHHLEKVVQTNHYERQKMEDFYRSQGYNIISDCANFVTLEVPETGPQMYGKLLKQGIITRPLVPYGMEKYLRVSVGSTEENTFCQQAFQKIN